MRLKREDQMSDVGHACIVRATGQQSKGRGKERKRKGKGTRGNANGERGRK